ncbi:hypothetical protein AAHN34_004492 [Salmonella enterica]|nr:hypothetical protein [Salmonella enterica subsp. enterica serovar Enteritidis]
MATNTQVNHLVSMMRNELVTCNERSVRCELRRNELQHRQNQLFKVLTEALKKYERMGFIIVFTGEHELRCWTPEPEKDTFLFPLPAFSIVRKHHSLSRFEQTKQVRLSFKPTVNGNGAISYTFEKYDPDVTSYGCGELSWQAGTPGQNDGYWFINAGAHKLIMDSPLSLEGAEMLFTTLYD